MSTNTVVYEATLSCSSPLFTLLMAAQKGDLGACKSMLDNLAATVTLGRPDNDEASEQEEVSIAGSMLVAAAGAGQLHIVQYITEEAKLSKKWDDFPIPKRHHTGLHRMPKLTDMTRNGIVVPIFHAACAGHMPVCLYLIDQTKKSKRHALKRQAMIGAAIGGHLQVCMCLVAWGITLHDIMDTSALVYAARNGHASICEYFVTTLGLPAEHLRESRVLLHAAKGHQVDVCLFLLRRVLTEADLRHTIAEAERCRDNEALSDEERRECLEAWNCLVDVARLSLG